MVELWFIRHFRTPWNSQGRLQGQRDIALDNPMGPQDLAMLAANRQALTDQDFALVLTSPLSRARQTAELYGFPGAEADPDLAEIAFGDWEGRTWDELEAAHPGAWQNALHTLPLGESMDEFSTRIARVRDRIRGAQGPVLAFGHGAWLGGLQLLQEGRQGGMPRQTLANGALIRLTL
ncbi:histidine phosphatase family protein [Pollutimonas harenae]|uniref:Histidine phosphatase family protein n=1 Tax=Pollutimonas harenae TaxID=657015 RepID=A0A853GW82_9BURK|nr:histidine phosphatase family protein [Pollutimonas harenae]NYT86397.1 histidine phosphatase family protein [Pollutimonas harenae]TEA69849.1 histidine phosphatase family protein [Pollutimonas harenae]